ncbi:N-acetyltransferase family protein [Streptomyces sp. JNUCC 64]
MTLTFVTDPVLDAALGEELTALWVDVSNAGGAVGFVPPVTPEHVRPEVTKHFAAVTEGRSRMLTGRDERGALVAVAFLTLNQHQLMAHWAWLYTVMVHPGHQGAGHGRALMAAAADLARVTPGLEAVRLSCRGGLGLERFYASCGYQEVGRVPGAVRVAPGDDRDETVMLLALA